MAGLQLSLLKGSIYERTQAPIPYREIHGPQTHLRRLIQVSSLSPNIPSSPLPGDSAKRANLLALGSLTRIAHRLGSEN